MDNNFIIQCLGHLAKFKQLGSIDIKDKDVLMEYVKVFAEIGTREELVSIFRELKHDDSSDFFPSLGKCRKAIGYKSDEEQQWIISEEISQFIIKRNSDISKLRFATRHYFEKLGRSQGINFQQDDQHALSKLKRRIEINWEPSGPKLGRIATSTTNPMLSEGQDEKKP
ncbi:MAG: hypothetical protein GWN31_08100 [Candidatus Thorarchaeota archaeon]|nr:hypothetical protein [Candidatus Thorarchaeota archaeon]NIW51987.1 hypothetical protein [Candidatus Korarchaeota archaeon]